MATYKMPPYEGDFCMEVSAVEAAMARVLARA